ncbi:MAG: beta-galactosidase trimerization domain-containing protein, partial [Armatimonadetes bacterium]|nr:beta-galactosidase trimerization domain-containing protein [Armatimonadota bacterium]
PRLKAKYEFATAPEDKAIVKTFDREAEPSLFNFIVPPDFSQPDNLPKLQMDLDIAEATGKIADGMKWPTVGKKPALFPFLVCESTGGWWPHDKKVVEREWKTLDHFGFSNREKESIGGLWHVKNDCYSQPDLPTMRASVKSAVEAFNKEGKKVENIAYCMLMDEPGGQDPSHIARCTACTEQFREWVRQLGKTPADLLVADWNGVKPVEAAEADKYPALWYYTQKFRTHALGKFMATQKETLHEAYNAKFPVNVNFSDGATYTANFYGQGVDYFELLESEGQNAIWSENWGNGAASRQCTTYNVELMRSAAMKRGQHLGQYLIAYAGRLPWDIKLNTVSQAARGVKCFNNFWYGPSWSGHEGGPPWACSAWYSKPETWYSNAEVVREIGGAEDLLFPAKKVRSQVAILYSSSTDIWTLGKNYAYGFDRMFLWQALAHAQIPVDFLSEKGVEEGGLEGYKVCYLSGPNLSQTSAERLRAWVKDGGTLLMTAGAAMRDEYNRPLSLLDEIVPADRGKLEEFQPYLNSGSYLYILKPNDTVTVAKSNTQMEVLSVKQALTPKTAAQTLGTFKDGSPALILGKAGKGAVYCSGFLPGLAYMQPPVLERNKVQEQVNKMENKETGLPDPAKVVSEADLLRRSHCPWKYPDGIRNLIALPVREAKVIPPIQCSVPLVDAVLMESPKGAVVPLSNYTLQPLKKVTLTVQTGKPVKRVVSVHQGNVPFERLAGGRVKLALPLKETDFVKLYY